MGRAFSTQRGTTRVLFGAGSSKKLSAELETVPSAPRRVLVITTNNQRADNVLATIRACVQEQDRALFLVADRLSLAAADIFSYLWRDARGQKHGLI